MSYIQSTSPGQNIKLMIDQLEKDVRNLSEIHHSDMVRVTDAIVKNLERLRNEFNKQLINLEQEDKTRIVELEEEICYLKELTISQHMMMEDNLKYLNELEGKLNCPSIDALKD